MPFKPAALRNSIDSGPRRRYVSPMSPQPISADARPKISPRARVQTDKATGKPVLLYPEGLLKLNHTGHAIVTLCNGETTLTDMVVHLAQRYQVPAPEILSQVTDYLNRLRALNLLELTGDGSTKP